VGDFVAFGTVVVGAFVVFGAVVVVGAFVALGSFGALVVFTLGAFVSLAAEKTFDFILLTYLLSSASDNARREAIKTTEIFMMGAGRFYLLCWKLSNL